MTGSYTPTPQGHVRPCGNVCLGIAGPRDLAVKEYTEWQQPNVVDEKLRVEFSRVCEGVLEGGMGLEEVYEDPKPGFFVQNGIKSGIARRVTGGLKACADQDKSAYNSGIINASRIRLRSPASTVQSLTECAFD